VCCKLKELKKLTEEDKEKAIVVFVTYSLLSQKCHVKTLIQWAGGSDFEGCLLFDESHIVRVVVLPVVRSRCEERHQTYVFSDCSLACAWHSGLQRVECANCHALNDAANCHLSKCLLYVTCDFANVTNVHNS
jgi:P-loop containing NTP hydrolase pore-1